MRAFCAPGQEPLNPPGRAPFVVGLLAKGERRPWPVAVAMAGTSEGLCQNPTRWGSRDSAAGVGRALEKVGAGLERGPHGTGRLEGSATAMRTRGLLTPPQAAPQPGWAPPDNPLPQRPARSFHVLSQLFPGTRCGSLMPGLQDREESGDNVAKGNQERSANVGPEAAPPTSTL